MDYSAIQVNDVYFFDKTITKDEVLKFAELSGDYNKLHVDEAYGIESNFGKNIAHGMLCASLFSQLVGMHCPGEKSLYLTQTLNFKAPVFYGDNLRVRGTVTSKNDSIRVITLKTEILKEDKIVISGEAKIKVL